MVREHVVFGRVDAVGGRAEAEVVEVDDASQESQVREIALSHHAR